VFLIAGLGNPGTLYESTRHNVGFEIINRIVDGELFQKVTGVSCQLPSRWSPCKLGGPSEIVEGHFTTEVESSLVSQRVVLVKPLTFMNRSGGPLGALCSYYKIPLNGVLVIHDELDLTRGDVRLKTGGGEAGHNGLRSISECLGSKQYSRIRIGIGRPAHSEMDIASYVLGKFDREDMTVLASKFSAIGMIIKEWMNRSIALKQ
jgi:peptidyl-tRNA hydrolase, PTH1 family